MKTNCLWKEVYAIYDTLIPQEKAYLGNHFIDSPYTVFRWIIKRNTKNAGFIMLYDMKRPGIHKGELIVTVAIWEKYRGMGILEELEDAIEQFVISNPKYNRLVWYAKDDNKKSIHCAKKLGYTNTGHELDHWVFIKKFPKDSHNIKRDITRFNNRLNKYDYGIVVDGKAYTNNIDFSKYTTIDPDTFELYQCGTCWDYTEYESKVFEDKFCFDFTLNALKHDREFSLYYMQIVDITDVRKIEFDSNSFNTIKDGDSLKLFSNVNGSIIDNNFDELDSRISAIEAQNRLRIDGELIRCKNEIDELKKRITELEKYIKIEHE